MDDDYHALESPIKFLPTKRYTAGNVISICLLFAAAVEFVTIVLIPLAILTTYGLLGAKRYARYNACLWSASLGIGFGVGMVVFASFLYFDGFKLTAVMPIVMTGILLGFPLSCAMLYLLDGRVIELFDLKS